ncbi:ABC transporter permease subunit [Metabacillus idriensis]|uniref:ABC transporter permease subunit n=1 Tax=Metabacillus idriensis TaxID=324768 RepID=UPI002812AB42|nr:ABC transporter permease subunit [Metabacillus idriensis]MDR0137025.1 ABC transporter permease subunit [Metabacillus idriensis]
MKLLAKNKLWPLLPAVLFTAIMAGAGLWMAAIESVTSPGGTINTAAYAELLKNPSFQASFLYSLKITIVSVSLSMIIGLLIVRSTFPLLQKKHLRLAAWIPMLFPHFVWGYMLYLLFSQSGWFSTLFFQAGFIESPKGFPDIMKSEGGAGIILTYLWKEIPFVILVLLPVYQQLNMAKKEAVYTLGGSKWEAFKTVEWPVILPSIIEIFVILFSFIFAAYEVPALLGATYPKMISVLTFEWFYSGDWSRRPLAFAAMIATAAAILICLFTVYMILNRQRERITKESTIEFKDSEKGSNAIIFMTLGLFLLPVVFVLFKSAAVSWKWGNVLPDGFSMRSYMTLFQEPKLFEAVIQSAEIALWVIGLNLLIGTPAAKVLAHQSFRGKAAIETLLLTPIIVPALTIALGLHIVFIRAGLAGSMAGVVLIHMLPTLPYTIKVMRSGFERIGVKWEEQAKTLGAGNLSIFYLIFLPQLLPSIRSVIFLACTISLSQYLLTALIGGGLVVTLASLFFPYFSSADDAVIASFSVLFALIPILIWLLFEGFIRLVTPYQKR